LLVASRGAVYTMITQVFKRWLHKIFGWLSGKPVAKTDYAQTEAPLNTSMTTEQLTPPALDEVTPPSGVAPLILGQGETSCSTLDERPDGMLQPPPSPPSPPIEKIELPTSPPPIPTTPPVETTITESLPAQAPSGGSARNVPLPATPTPKQRLEFLQYLVKRGIVNEGFVEGQIPWQYRSKS
jgi:hypothetical protein